MRMKMITVKFSPAKPPYLSHQRTKEDENEDDIREVLTCKTSIPVTSEDQRG